MFNRGKRSSSILVLAILIISVTLFAVACGGDEVPPPTPEPTSTPGPPTATPTPEPPTATPTPSAEDHIKQGISYYEQGEMDKAIIEYKAAIELEPDNERAYLSRGAAYGELGQHELAINDLQKALELTQDEDIRAEIVEYLGILGVTVDVEVTPTP